MFRLFGLLLVGLVLAGCQEGRVITSVVSTGGISLVSDERVCSFAIKKSASGSVIWAKSVFPGSGSFPENYVSEAKRRGLSCGVDEKSATQIATSATTQSSTSIENRYAGFQDAALCSAATIRGNWDTNPTVIGYVKEAKRRGLSCGVGEKASTKIASTTTTPTQSNNPTSEELLAAQRKAEELEQQLAALKAQQEQQQQTISNDTQIPLITIASANTKGKQGVIRGRASDNVGVAEVTIDGNTVAVQSNGSFEYSTFVPATGLAVTVQATDMAGLSSKQTVSLQRNVNLTSASISFDRLNPIGKRTKQNNNALALIIGVSDYENTPAKAVFADADAMMFRDYASEKLGIPDSRIKTMVNDNADIRELLLSVKNWLSRSVTQSQSDVYIFFAGHGLASDDGSKMYLLPYDGAPELLDDTAILRERLFSDVAAANPRSVTVFLDTCYSGTTRGTDMLIASRPIAIRALEQSIPDNFTVMTAAAGDQTAKPLEEAKHGMFSYFLMKGMEGEADANNDNEITAGELHSYVQTNVIQQSSGSQTPELQGDADRVLVRFQ